LIPLTPPLFFHFTLPLNGAVAKSYMNNGLLIYVKYLRISSYTVLYKEDLSHR
jgi:hypothetical protein